MHVVATSLHYHCIIRRSIFFGNTSPSISPVTLLQDEGLERYHQPPWLRSPQRRRAVRSLLPPLLLTLFLRGLLVLFLFFVLYKSCHPRVDQTVILRIAFSLVQQLNTTIGPKAHSIGRGAVGPTKTCSSLRKGDMNTARMEELMIPVIYQRDRWVDLATPQAHVEFFPDQHTWINITRYAPI